MEEAGMTDARQHPEKVAMALGYDIHGSPDISEQEYLKHKDPAYGKTNPELASNPFWKAMVKCGSTAYDAIISLNRRPLKDAPVWCYADRHGMSTTWLPDGRVIQIGGKHDHNSYLNFWMYNDVIVHDGKGDFDIYTYPKEVFPPIYSHTATLAGNYIYVIGNMGYYEYKNTRPPYTPVFRLDITTMAIEKVKTSGDVPYCMYLHNASYDGTSTITIEKGRYSIPGDLRVIENQDRYSLFLESMQWKKNDTSHSTPEDLPGKIEIDSSIIPEPAILTPGTDRSRSERDHTSLVHAYRCNSDIDEYSDLDEVRQLITGGANIAELGWTDIFHAIALGNTEDLKKAIASGCDLEHKDCMERTPFLLSVMVGDTAKTAMLIEAGVNIKVYDKDKKHPLFYAIIEDNVDMLKLLLDNGLHHEQRDLHEYTPLIIAAEQGAIKCLKALIAMGADVSAESPYASRYIEIEDIDDEEEYIERTAIKEASTPEIVAALVKAGANFNHVKKSMRAVIFGYSTLEDHTFWRKETPKFADKDLEKYKSVLYGKTNPELATNSYWQTMIKHRWSTGQIASAYNVDKFKHKPVWTYYRSYSGIAPLPDGRYVEIGGECFEYSGSPSNWVYNDVIVHDGKGNCDIYIYPEEVFSAFNREGATLTLVDQHIYITGYSQLLRLDIATMKIEIIESSGDRPEHIGKHDACYDGKSKITIQKVGYDSANTKIDYSNEPRYELCLKSMQWKKLA